MIPFAIAEGSCGIGQGHYEDGLLTMPDGGRRGIETVSVLETRTRDRPSVPDLVGSLRGALPGQGRLPLLLRLAVSTARAGLGLVEEGLAPGGHVAVAIAFADGTAVVARMPPALVDTLRRDRQVVRQAFARAGEGPSMLAPVPAAAEADEAMTSIFRYEKRNGRLRRVAGSDRSRGL